MCINKLTILFYSNLGADCELPNTGVYIADGSYPCSALLDPTDRLGIYKNRGKICDDKLTSCCITCETVRQELAVNGTSSGTTIKPTPSTKLQTITGGNPVNQGIYTIIFLHFLTPPPPPPPPPPLTPNHTQTEFPNLRILHSFNHKH